MEAKIQDKSEPQFREFIKSNYFYGKSVVEKNKFIKDHPWFSKLYPSSIMEKYKVVFLTTAKFFNPIDSFHRMPFFLADDGLLNNSVVFIDEFDAFLHFGAAETVVKMLNEQTHFQTILTTHNTSLLSNELSRPDCSFIMHRSVENDETIQISSLSNLTEREIRKVHNLEKMYRSGAFGYNV